MSRRYRLCPLGGSCPPDARPAAPPGSCRSQGGSLCPCIESSCKGRTRAGRWCSSTSAALHLGRPPRCNLQMKAGSEPQARQGAVRPGVARDCVCREAEGQADRGSGTPSGHLCPTLSAFWEQAEGGVGRAGRGLPSHCLLFCWYKWHFDLWVVTPVESLTKPWYFSGVSRPEDTSPLPPLRSRLPDLCTPSSFHQWLWPFFQPHCLSAFNSLVRQRLLLCISVRDRRGEARGPHRPAGLC